MGRAAPRGARTGRPGARLSLQPDADRRTTGRRRDRSRHRHPAPRASRAPRVPARRARPLARGRRRASSCRRRPPPPTWLTRWRRSACAPRRCRCRGRGGCPRPPTTRPGRSCSSGRSTTGWPSTRSPPRGSPESGARSSSAGRTRRRSRGSAARGSLAARARPRHRRRRPTGATPSTAPRCCSSPTAPTARARCCARRSRPVCRWSASTVPPRRTSLSSERCALHPRRSRARRPRPGDRRGAASKSAAGAGGRRARGGPGRIVGAGRRGGRRRRAASPSARTRAARPHRVVIANLHASGGGGERFVRELAAGLAGSPRDGLHARGRDDAGDRVLAGRGRPRAARASRSSPRRRSGCTRRSPSRRRAPTSSTSHGPTSPRCPTSRAPLVCTFHDANWRHFDTYSAAQKEAADRQTAAWVAAHRPVRLLEPVHPRRADAAVRRADRTGSPSCR